MSVDIRRPKQCKGCRGHHSGGLKGTVYQNWCCKFGAYAPKILGHCKQMGGFSAKTQEPHS